MAKRRNVVLTVRVTYVRTPDDEVRISRAIDILFAAACRNEDRPVHTDEDENWENGLPNSDADKDSAGEGS